MEIRLTQKVYERTASGKGWKSQPSETTEKTINREYYNNMASDESIDFWNGFCGGTCRAYKTYTTIGYVPYKIVRVNPEGTEKHIDEFDFW